MRRPITIYGEETGGLGIAPGVAIAIGGALTSAITSGVQMGLQYHQASKAFSLQKQLQTARLMMDWQAHEAAMKEAALTIEDLKIRMAQSQVIGEAQKDATLLTIEAQEAAVKRGDFATAHEAISLQRAAVDSGTFDVLGVQKAQQKATVVEAAARGQAEGASGNRMLTWIALGVAAIALMR